MQCFERSNCLHNSGSLGRRVGRRAITTNTVSLPVQTNDQPDLKAIVDDILYRVEGTGTVRTLLIVTRLASKICCLRF
jgi:hypothetical protein